VTGPITNLHFFFTQVSCNVRNRPLTIINEPYDERHLGRKTKRQHQILFDSCLNHALPLDVLGIHLAGTREKSGNLQPYTNHALVFSYLPPVEFDTRSSPNWESKVWGNASPRHHIKLWRQLRVSPKILLQEERLLNTLRRLTSPLISHPTGPVSIPLYPEASPGEATTRHWWRVGFPDFLGLTLVSAGCCTKANSTDGSSRYS